MVHVFFFLLPKKEEEGRAIKVVETSPPLTPLPFPSENGTIFYNLFKGSSLPPLLFYAVGDARRPQKKLSQLLFRRV